MRINLVKKRDKKIDRPEISNEILAWNRDGLMGNERVGYVVNDLGFSGFIFPFERKKRIKL